MKFGVREICDVVFKANQAVKIGGTQFVKGQPVLYIDTAKTSTIEGAASTVYATGGKGNSRLIAWEGEKTLTFTVEDALLSPMGFAILSGAGLFDLTEKTAMVHCTAEVLIDANGSITLSEKVSRKAPIFVTVMKDGSFVTMLKDVKVESVPDPMDASIEVSKLTLSSTQTLIGEEKSYKDGTKVTIYRAPKTGETPNASEKDAYKGETAFIDYYVEKTAGVTEIQIDASHFAGYYYVEASTLFRREKDGKDLPAEIVFPRVKIQSNFTFTMASSGDPSTFTFTMDAFPAYTMFDRSRKVLCAMQIIDEDVVVADQLPVTEYDPVEPVLEVYGDSTEDTPKKDV